MQSYNQFCPIAKACEVLEPRWTLLILCEMWSGSSRFNEIKRGVPSMSPSLLSKRLKGMEDLGLITREELDGNIDYKITEIGHELGPIVFALGKWAHRNIDAEVTLEKLDAKLLMWNVRRKVDISPFTTTKKVIQFVFTELGKDKRNFWLIYKPGCSVDLCTKDPGFEVDLCVMAELKALTSVWIGLSELADELRHKKIVLLGDKHLAATIDQWMVRSDFAPKLKIA
ncbi:helix-turn-helix domain-containing protein [Simiduia curdlanivorans]|uniref:Winged helix-turn-helix transcriptional regulator n=1 Tax=Simiduia curdlanivorans TaxID=1492769 RepID=A0ABV8V8G1_9GAMM|nr:helix-turn-helix domain-containing protein [Simiduia curdlanivorans]MDN3638791.1 helix-turn-helix domain-containing protein [Simiduia curdlanivorans]